MKYKPHDPDYIAPAPSWTKPRAKQYQRDDSPFIPKHPVSHSVPKRQPGPDKSDKGPAISGLTPSAYARLMRIAQQSQQDMESFD